MTDVLLIHAEWCGHCKALKPEWDKMKEELKSNENISIHEIESADKDKDSKLDEFSKKAGGEKISVRGFPMILKFENGKMTEYTGERSADKLAKWAQGDKSGGGKRRSRRVLSKKRKAKRRKTSSCKKCSFSFW
jgi:thiol-disulfide isomerase/thioredoxin